MIEITGTDVIGRVQGHEFEIGEFRLEIPDPVQNQTIIPNQEISGSMNQVVGFPFECLFEEHFPRKEPLVLDIIVECEPFPVILQQTVFESLPVKPHKKDIVDLEYAALTLDRVE